MASFAYYNPDFPDLTADRLAETCLEENRDWLASTVRTIIDRASKRGPAVDKAAIAADVERAVRDGLWGSDVPLGDLGLERPWDIGVEDTDNLKSLTRRSLIAQVTDIVSDGLTARAVHEPLEAVRKLLWSILRSAPYGSFSDEPWDALGDAESLCQGMTVRERIGPDRELIAEDWVFPMTAIALAALHTAADALAPAGRELGSARRHYTDWDFRDRAAGT